MSMFNHSLIKYRIVMSRSPPYFQSPLVMHALSDSLKDDPVGPLGNIPRENASGGKDPWEGSSKRAAFAVFNHLFNNKQDYCLLVSGEQERWSMELCLSEKGRETGLNKPDLLVEIFNPVDDTFSDLIFCEVKRKDPRETYKKLLDQISECAAQKKTSHINEHVFACVMYGTRASFFMAYDLEQPEPNYNSLVPLYPKDMEKRVLEDDMGAIVHEEDGEIFACEFDLLDVRCQPFMHACFIEMSRSSGPIDPEDDESDQDDEDDDMKDDEDDEDDDMKDK